MNKLLSWLAFAMVLSQPIAAVAQQRADMNEPKATASVPPLRYLSAFADYQPWQDIKPGDWRQLNDKVAPSPDMSGGHGAMHGGASASADAPASKASAPSSDMHHGHHKNTMKEGKK